MIAHRYPNTRPSDFYGELDNYQSFQLDSAIALKGKIRDQEHEADVIHVLLQGMVGIMKSQGAKPKALQKPSKMKFGEKEDVVPHVNEILAALTGEGTYSG